ncbi:carboxymuconolactone decarboxylase family protein [Deinococcus sp.]|uniref:carboxymuconolactone decarboxylase family protein n=1 Tax=Deinococcus sp. TaxID=47478 RepID=UPI002869D0F3|nr:carboxymuconolactone decarboxylase family protein [Deinococcus sp.]
MPERMHNPAQHLPGTLPALLELGKLVHSAIPAGLAELINLRASQINGCSVCVIGHARALKQAGESDDRLASVAAWRDAPYFTDAERAALALAEAGTRLSDRAVPMPDALWQEAAKHYDETQLAGIVLCIGAINIFNRMNVITTQVGGQSW